MPVDREFLLLCRLVASEVFGKNIFVQDGSRRILKRTGLRTVGNDAFTLFLHYVFRKVRQNEGADLHVIRTSMVHNVCVNYSMLGEDDEESADSDDDDDYPAPPRKRRRLRLRYREDTEAQAVQGTDIAADVNVVEHMSEEGSTYIPCVSQHTLS